MKSGPEFELLGKNLLGEVALATPAVSDGRLFIRTATALYCVSQASGAGLRQPRQCVGEAGRVEERSSRVRILEPSRRADNIFGAERVASPVRNQAAFGSVKPFTQLPRITQIPAIPRNE